MSGLLLYRTAMVTAVGATVVLIVTIDARNVIHRHTNVTLTIPVVHEAEAGTRKKIEKEKGRKRRKMTTKSCRTKGRIKINLILLTKEPQSIIWLVC